jgi:hypothetical protein
MPLGGLLTFWYSRKHKGSGVKSYILDLMKYVWISFMVSLFVVLFFQQKLGNSTYPMVLLVYGIWLFVSGGALQFRPLIIGGIINWVLAGTAFFFDSEYQLLFLSTAVVLGYIIPGYLLKAKYRNEKKQASVLNQ